MLSSAKPPNSISIAAGVVALETMVDRLREDHANARVLAEGLASLPGIVIDLARVQTNIVIFTVKRKDLDAPGLIVKLAEHGIKAFAITPDSIRMVTHKDVNRAGILRTLEVLRTILG